MYFFIITHRKIFFHCFSNFFCDRKAVKANKKIHTNKVKV